MPAGLKRLAPSNVVLRPLAEKLEVVTTAAAWSTQSPNPALGFAVEELKTLKST
ncbi:hypothetical protein D9M68_968550 [compost metagenome]